jgi:NAD(P)-dependent dehydrogenase (short-subunit alcohol dehydrogenase family)
MKDVSSISVLGNLVFMDCTDDSGGTVNSPMAVQYNTGKAALIRAVGCIQEELNLDGEDNIAVYALHPGGVLSGLQGPSLHLAPVPSFNTVLS